MTGSTVVNYIKSVNPDSSAYEDSVFLVWLNELDKDVQTDLFLLNLEDIVEHTALSEELLADSAHSIIYGLYLSARIDLARKEFTSYQNNYAVFSKAYGAYKTWYISRYNPGNGQAEISGYYLSAYSLAVKHGYEGTEEEWIASVEAARLSAEESATSAAESAEAAANAREGAESAKNEVITNTETATAAANAAENAKNDALTAKTEAEAAKHLSEEYASAAGDAATSAGEFASQAVSDVETALETAKSSGAFDGTDGNPGAVYQTDEPTFAAVWIKPDEEGGILGPATTTENGLMSASDKSKLNGIETGAQVNPTIDSALSSTSENAVQNKAIKAALDAHDTSINTLSTDVSSAVSIAQGVRDDADAGVFDGGIGPRGYSGLVPAITAAYASNVTVAANTMTTLTLSGATTVTLGAGVSGYDNEWDVIIPMPNPVVTLTLPTVSWGQGYAPTFAAGTTTIIRLYYVGATLCGEWVTA